jgi:hypothetical protein
LDWNDALGAVDVCNLEPNHLARASHPWREYVDAGGLMSYGINLRDQYRRAADYVLHKILKGAEGTADPTANEV